MADQVPQPAAVAAQPAVAAQVPAAPAVVHFALTPARVSNAVIDYDTESGRKQFKAATAALQEKFNLDSSELQLFLQMLSDRVYEQDWTDVILVPIDGDVTNLKNLTTHYGEVPLADVRAHALSYVMGVNRAAQDSMQLYTCLMSSLTKEALNRVRLKRDEYTIVSPLGSMVSGSCLLKVIIGVSHIDTMATVSQLRTRLSSLDTYMVAIQSDIDKFNLYVNTCLESLHARGESTQDLMVNLFKGYSKASDKAFKDYISKKEDFYEEGGAITTDDLMMFALTKFQTLTDKGLWNTPDEADEKIIALEAEVSRLKKRGAPPAAKKQASPGGAKSKDAASTSSKSKAEKKSKPAWMLVAPSGSEPHVKSVTGKEYYWCPKHNAWGRHTPQSCEGKGIPFKDLKKPGGGNSGQSDAGQGGKSMKLANALAAVVSKAREEEDN